MEVTDLVEKALNIRSFYHKVLASNVANVETPNYKEKDVDFNAALRERMTKGTEDIKVTEKTEYNGLNSSDGNTVNMEDQIMKITENSLYFNSLARVISKKFALMKYIIREGRG